MMITNNDNKRYYWLKLKKDFFQQHQIKVLKALPNGRLYALIYLELLAESTSHSGELRYSQMLPYDVITLANVIDEDKDNVEKAIETLIKLELVEILEDKTIYMREIQTMIGSETGQTIRKRRYKEKAIDTPKDEPKLIENKEEDKIVECSTELSLALKDFEEMRKKIKRPMTERAKKMIISKLHTLTNGDEKKQIEILNQSIVHCWQDVYPLKEDRQRNNGRVSVGDILNL